MKTSTPEHRGHPATRHRGGRPVTIDPAAIRAALLADPCPARVARTLGVSRSSVYRLAPPARQLV